MKSDVVIPAALLAGDGEVRFLRALVEHSTDMVSIIGADGSLMFHYPPALLGYTEGQNVGESVFDFIHPDDLPAALEHFASALATPGLGDPFECRILGADGAWHWIELIGTNLLDDPVIEGVVVNGRDITKRRDAEEALRKSGARFKALVQHASELMLVWDAGGAITYASPATLRFAMGHVPDDPDDDVQHISMYMATEDRNRVTKLVIELSARPAASERFVAKFRRHDGEYRSLEIIVTNLIDDPDIHGIVANGRDITDQLEFQEALGQSEEWFRSLVQHGSDIVAVLDADGRVRYVSPSIQNVLGYDPPSLIDGIGFEFVHRGDLSRLVKHFAVVLATHGHHGAVEMRARHADGTWRWLEVGYTNQLDNPAVAGVVLNFRDVTERRHMADELAHQAVHDSLTGLPNRVLLSDRLEQALTRAARDVSTVGVVFLDLDRFKLVNDTRGHVAGDSLLVAVARRLRSATRAQDTVARFGGDEFVVVYEDVTGIDGLVDRARRLCDMLAVPFVIDGHEVYATISVGVAVGHTGASVEDLLRDADAAMYHAKERGGGTVEVFDESIRLRAHTRYETERALRGALERDEFALVYQPLIEIASGRLIGMEALLRWDHPVRGTIGPGLFIELAEETGLIVAIGAQTLDRACRKLAEWRTLPGAEELGMSVNVSAVQLRDQDLPGHVASALQLVGLPPDALTLEITESLLIEDTTACLDGLNALNELGVRLVVDDFGTGYSSLGYLNRMHIDGLKIDQTFVQRLGEQPRDTAIISAIIAMADALGLSVVAEGIETADQATRLMDLGCQFGQGFRFAVPLRPDDAMLVVAAGKAEPSDIIIPERTKPATR